MLSVLKGERLSPLVTRCGEARPLRLFPARRGEFKKVCHGDIKRRGCFSSSSPQILQVTTPRDLRDLRESRRCCSGTTYATAIQQYDYAALFFRPSIFSGRLVVKCELSALVPCRSGMCSTPMEVTSSQLISSEIFPLPLVKAMLYPGAVANGLITSRMVPSWDNLLNIYNLTNVKEASAVTDLQRLEVWP
ncbi:hypothetical protein KY289_029209 [Solanum tuberosum]|nr:hypothetical protein KY289_029209 [Solanum tuberosum]